MPEARKPAPQSAPVSRRSFNAAHITLAHGGGGKAMRDLIDDVFLTAFGCDGDEDQARLDAVGAMPQGARLAFTGDGFVVRPLEFPGGDIGRLAVCGTVNDLVVGGATPHWLSASFILEEGLEIDLLRRVVASMRAAADEAGIAIVTGDTKVVERGSADKMFITTSGIGIIPESAQGLSASAVQAGDAIIVNGVLGDHGAAILAARGEMSLSADIQSDCRPLGGIMQAVLAATPNLRCARDATRGGLASALNEIAAASGVGMLVEEARIPLRREVQGVCEILGLDPLYLANEGTLVLCVPAPEAEAVLAAMRGAEGGRDSVIIGHARKEHPGMVEMATRLGGMRIVDMLVGEQLPRIC